MNIESKLIDLLSSGAICSGTEIGAQLGISRVAVKKRISQLIEQGLPVVALPGKGYCLEQNADLLSESQIRNAIPDAFGEQIDQIEVHQSLSSTNEYLRENSPKETGKARAILAESQPGGKGRRGRGWVTTPYRNLMLSVAWRYSQWPVNPAALSLAFAVSVHQALLESRVKEATIKWPNDILLNDRKLAGLLVEAGGEASGACDLVFGVGVNFHIDPATGNQIDQDWVHLTSVDSVDMSRNQMAANILTNLIETLMLFQTDGFAPFAEYWNSHAAYVGQSVRLFNDEKEFQGTLKGVDETGVLILDGFDSETYRFTQADISLRPLNPSENK